MDSMIDSSKHSIQSGGTLSEKVPFNNLTIQWAEIAREAQPQIEQVFQRSAFSAGPFTAHFEKQIASYLGATHAIAVSSGTAALHLACLAAGIGPGDEVLVPSHTFIATLWGVVYAGAKPVLCDVDEQTGTINVDDAERRVTRRTKAIIPVHLYGQPANVSKVQALAEKHALFVIEDNAQAFGAKWDGKALGTIGKVGWYARRKPWHRVTQQRYFGASREKESEG
jgi:dTDP-4-amino-4,6-dideoxygalactose transaminase